jgi:hypothetical protein
MMAITIFIACSFARWREHSARRPCILAARRAGNSPTPRRVLRRRTRRPRRRSLSGTARRPQEPPMKTASMIDLAQLDDLARRLSNLVPPGLR